MGQVEHQAGVPSSHVMAPRTALLVMPLLLPFLAPYFIAAALLGLHATFAGAIFLMYWFAFRRGGVAEFLPALVGMLVAIAVSWMLHALPLRMGNAGLAAPMAIILASIFCLLCGWLTWVFNYGFMLMLTVATIQPLAAANPYADLAGCTLLGAAYFGGVLLTADAVARRRREAAAG